MPHRREGLHLWEHDSTVWVHFCLLESAISWWICALSLCKCESVGGRSAESVSFDYDSFCDFSEVGYHVRVHPCCRRKVATVQRKIPPLHECTESQSAFFMVMKVR